MYSTQANHIEAYKSWSNYKGYNQAVTYTSPLSDTPMNAQQFEAHISQDYLQAGMSKDALNRAMTGLFRSY